MYTLWQGFYKELQLRPVIGSGDAFNHTHSSLPFGCVLSLDRESTSDPNKKGITWNDEFGIKALFNQTLNAAGGPTLKTCQLKR